MIVWGSESGEPSASRALLRLRPPGGFFPGVIVGALLTLLVAFTIVHVRPTHSQPRPPVPTVAPGQPAETI